MPFEKPVVIIDNGSRYIKAGFSCDNSPVAIFRSVVGRPKYLNGTVGKEYYDVLIGDEAECKIDDYDLYSPIDKGIIVNWDSMERIWHNIFYKALKVAPEDRSVILAVSPLTSMEDKYKCCQELFEVLNTPSMCIQPQCVLALYGAGMSTGIVVDIGYNSININPIYEGGVITYAHTSNEIGASRVMDHINNDFKKRGLNFGNESDAIIEDIIKKVCYVSPNASISMKKKEYERLYTLKTGEQIDVSLEAFASSELMFQPHLVLGNEDSKLGRSIYDSVIDAALKCDEELRDELYNAIVPCGGLSILPGLSERLSSEIETVIKRPVIMSSSTESYVLSWLGGAVFAGMNDAKKIFITKKQFEEHGMKMVRKKFM